MNLQTSLIRFVGLLLEINGNLITNKKTMDSYLNHLQHGDLKNLVITMIDANVPDVGMRMNKYEVTFEVQVTETVTVEANSAKEAEELAGNLGWWQASEGNWEITKQHIDVIDQDTANYQNRFRNV